MSDAVDAAERDRRRRLLWLTLILFIGLPIYLIAASFIVAAINYPVANAEGVIEKPWHWSVEALVYLVLGLVWAFPLKRLTLGVGRAAPRVEE